ncbi:hypothetical protein CW751_01940 [Brumimicrobium salinarum]|uniref:Peptidase S1 domain-containing protein n=1 Tax=Brumimicrobium salinarum TaxID=2058658 RepID=A0A2I0R6A9_9FLAO|nr:T9SS type A sorting domain-containing protein [Brumimicrobium salinarum]PKR82122.1 hypothetical protein CW751_01940 [Brumimicrobium salinarum]
MKKIFIFLGFVFSILLSFSQQGDGGQPQGYAKLLKSNIQIPEQSFKTPDVATLRAEDRINDELKTGPWRFGYKNNTSLTLHNSGIWKTLANGDRVWLLKVSSNEAITMNLIFSNTEIPNGNKLYVFNPDQSFILGSFTQKHLYKGELGTELIPGDEIIVEYYVPAYNANNLGNIEISAVTHGYRSAQELYAKSFGSSGSCNMNVNCPDGSPYISQRNSAIMVIVGGTSFCSGALINNTNFDGTPYVLTANHCYSSNYASTIFRFNWQADDCNNPSSSPSFQSITGAESRAKRLKSDFWLMEITAGLQNGTIPQSYSPFFAGWDRSNTIPSAALSIHHPAGDIKKISFEDDAPAPSNFTIGGTTSDPNGTWRIEWDRNTTTEGGSSGSPLFNDAGQIIGQLWGGNAGCSGPNSSGGNDFYGRVFNSWNPTGSNNDGQLEHWLDPGNTGSSEIEGYDPYGSNFEVDAKITKIDGYDNALCTTGFYPVIDVVNAGSNNLTSFTVRYSYNGAMYQTYDWTGNLNTYAVTSVQLPWMFNVNGNNTISIEIINPNATTDEDPTNNTMSANFEAKTDGLIADFEFNLDCWASESSWELKDENGVIIYEGNNYTPSFPDGIVVEEEFCLSNGCYELILYDTEGDGVNGSTYTNCNKSGSMTLTQRADGQVLAVLLEQDADFGSEASYNFCIDNVGLEKDDLSQSINIYPNPSSGSFTVETNIEGQKTVTLSNITGEVINVYASNKDKILVQEEQLSSGIYMLTIENESQRVVKKLIVK